ncbi:centromere protein W [Podarcis muralis]|uniref:centromere protein W n=1 Tax=Podarcis muralis TaxID=64176 RepID=UPI00109EF93F|nr:centromere protein W [Podarcis muralis]
MKNTVPRSTVKKLLSKHKPHLRMRANTDLLVHLNVLLFLHRLAIETRTNAIAEKSKTIKSRHVRSSAKVVLKKSRG